MTEEILFLTELLGLKVFDLKGRRIGVVKDAAIVPLVDPIRIDRFKPRQLEKHPVSHARPQARARRVGAVALEVHSAPVRPDPMEPKLAQLIPEGRLGAFGGGGEEAHVKKGLNLEMPVARTRKAILVDSRPLSPAVRSLTFRTADGAPLGHVAGQYLDLVVPTAGGLPFRRPYCSGSTFPRRSDLFGPFPK